MKPTAMRNHRRRLDRWFPKREFIVQADGKSRSITLSPRLQAAAVALLATSACAGIAGLGSLAGTRHETQVMHAALLDREAEVSREQQQVATFGDQVKAATARLEKRQDFIDRMVEMLPDADADGAGSADPAIGTTAGSDAALPQLGVAVPEASGLAQVERRQLAAVETLARFAQGRTARAEQAIRRLGLDPRRVVAATSDSVESGMGGPLEKLSTEADGSLDPRFERLGASLAHMAALEQGLIHMPQVMPTDLARTTSPFGYRRDPFTGEAAMHAGLDFAGRIGDPVHAAAAGTVSFVGVRSGYGNVVEIAHGNGLTTRYAHMSASKARVGQKVQAGAVIGAVGSTGRSTGPHLHFEVRVGERAVNPRPFLEKAPDILANLRS